MTLLTAVAFVLAITGAVVYLVVMFDGWSDRRDAERRNHR